MNWSIFCKLNFLSVYILFLLLLSSCGLKQDIVLLNQPSNPRALYSESKFTITITGSNDEDEFRGLEFYYKFYNDNTTNFDINLQEFDDFEIYGFKRLCSAEDKVGDEDKPLVYFPVENRGKDSIITIDFYDLSNPYIKAEPEETDGLEIEELSIRRGEPYPSGHSEMDYYMRFDDMHIDDGDISTYIDPAPVEGDDIKLLLYVICYGKQDVVNTVYSDPLCLSYITIKFTDEVEE